MLVEWLSLLRNRETHCCNKICYFVCFALLNSCFHSRPNGVLCTRIFLSVQVVIKSARLHFVDKEQCKTINQTGVPNNGTTYLMWVSTRQLDSPQLWAIDHCGVGGERGVKPQLMTSTLLWCVSQVFTAMSICLLNSCT